MRVPYLLGQGRLPESYVLSTFGSVIFWLTKHQQRKKIVWIDITTEQWRKITCFCCVRDISRPEQQNWIEEGHGKLNAWGNKTGEKQ